MSTTLAPTFSPAETARFWAKVEFTSECWLWTRSTDLKGYGVFGLRRGQNIGTHRYAYLQLVGSIPDGLWVLHNCPGGDNPGCVNPAHLWLGTAQDNVDDMWAKGRGSCGEHHWSKLHPERVARGDEWHTPLRDSMNRARWPGFNGGEANHFAKLTEQQVMEIRARYRRTTYHDTNAQALAQEFGISRRQLSAIVRGAHWKGAAS